MSDATDWFRCDSKGRKKNLTWYDRVPLEFAQAEDIDTLWPNGGRTCGTATCTATGGGSLVPSFPAGQCKGGDLDSPPTQKVMDMAKKKKRRSEAANGKSRV